MMTILAIGKKLTKIINFGQLVKVFMALWENIARIVVAEEASPCCLSLRWSWGDS
jgi:hypothetical protein